MSEPVLTKTTAAATYGGGIVAFVGGLSANEIAAYGGLAVAVLAWLSNTIITIYFKYAHLKLSRETAKTGRSPCSDCPEREG